MLRIIKFLITGDWHMHHWVQFDEIHVYDSDDDVTKMRIGIEYVRECSVCGAVKTFKQ